MRYEGLPASIDQIAATYAAPPWTEEIRRAREEYDARRGRVYDDDGLVETHMASFLEWYVLERALPTGAPPVIATLRQGGLAPGQEKLLRSLAFSYRSLFEVVDPLPKVLLLTDLIGGGLWRVEQNPPLEGIDPGDIFEARLIPWEGQVIFGPVFCFHPRQARESIHVLLSRAEGEGRLNEEIIWSLAEMWLRHRRFRNIAIERIYMYDQWHSDSVG